MRFGMQSPLTDPSGTEGQLGNIYLEHQKAFCLLGTTNANANQAAMRRLPMCASLSGFLLWHSMDHASAFQAVGGLNGQACLEILCGGSEQGFVLICACRQRFFFRSWGPTKPDRPPPPNHQTAQKSLLAGQILICQSVNIRGNPQFQK